MVHYPLIVIGAGAGGLVIAIGAAKAGKKVLLVEKGNYGGDCTNFGCIPSKATIAAAEIAHNFANLAKMGIHSSPVQWKASEVLEKTRAIVEEIRSHEEPETLSKFGIVCETATASFVDPHNLKLTDASGEEKTVQGDQIVIATGSYPHVPNIPGIDKIKPLTNETIFQLEEIPNHLGVIGGGPIGCELAQAFHRLGAKVTLIHHHEHLLNKEEKCAQSVIEEVFHNEGLSLYTGYEPVNIDEVNGKIELTLKKKKCKETEKLVLSHLLLSTGRIPHIDTLNLQAIGVNTTKKGVIVDKYGRTNHKHIWAVGDAAGRAIFTHLAENEARTVLTNLLLPGFLKYKLDRKQPLPRVTYTDPEVAALGLTEKEATEQYGINKIAIYTVPLREVDRAITTRRTEGFVRIITKKWSSQILGATIVAPRAGEMLMEISVAMYTKTPLRKLASIIHPYPTYSLGIRKAADKWLTETILPIFKRKRS